MPADNDIEAVVPAKRADSFMAAVQTMDCLVVRYLVTTRSSMLATQRYETGAASMNYAPGKSTKEALRTGSYTTIRPHMQ